jgi:menaquinone-dependent protoporphyrinogen IX oxidase
MASMKKQASRFEKELGTLISQHDAFLVQSKADFESVSVDLDKIKSSKKALNDQ